MPKLPEIDFLSAKLQHRLKTLSLKKEMLARALGLKTNVSKKIIDATAGLGRDSFILAALGFEVTLIERSPIIFPSLEKALKIAKSHEKTAAIIQRMHLIHADSISWLKQLKKNDYPDLIYIDPMFPEKKKSALPKKDMQLFQEIVGEDADAELLLKTALTHAKERVVVKRPRLAEPLGNIEPSFSLTGSSSRFDAYLIIKTAPNTN